MRGRVAIFLVGMGILLSFPQLSTAQWVRAGKPGGGWITALAVSRENIFAGTRQGGVFLSTDSGASWKAVSSGLPPVPLLTGAEVGVWIECLVVCGSNLFAGTEEGDVWRLPLSDIN